MIVSATSSPDYPWIPSGAAFPLALEQERQKIHSPTGNSRASKGGGRVASEILDLFASGAFSFWEWIPSTNVLTTQGNFSADSLEDWMLRIHPRDQADFSKFLDQDWSEVESPSFIDYRFTPNRQGDWVRVRHTASHRSSPDQPILSCLIESFPISAVTETPLERMANGLKGGEEELLRFVESALDLRIQSDPTPRLELLQRSIGADLMVLVHFGSKIIATHSVPLPGEPYTAESACLHLPLIEALASMPPLEHRHSFNLDLDSGSAEIAHFIVNPIHWEDGLKGALCAGYARKIDRNGDHRTTARLSLISAFTDGQLDSSQRLRAREEMLERFRRGQTPSALLDSADHESPGKPSGFIDSSSVKKQCRVSLVEANLKEATILLVEDETAVRKLVRKLLEMLGCSVIEAISGREALELWPTISDQVALVVSDVVMPGGVSGWDLAKELHKRHPALGILLTSGYDELPKDHGLQELPQIAFLQKPYEVRRLKTTLSRLMDLKLSAG